MGAQCYVRFHALMHFSSKKKMMFCRCFLDLLFTLLYLGDGVCLHQKKIDSNLYCKYLSSFWVLGKILAQCSTTTTTKEHLCFTNLTKAYTRLDMKTTGTDFGISFRFHSSVICYISSWLKLRQTAHTVYVIAWIQTHIGVLEIYNFLM